MQFTCVVLACTIGFYCTMNGQLLTKKRLELRRGREGLFTFDSDSLDNSETSFNSKQLHTTLQVA